MKSLFQKQQVRTIDLESSHSNNNLDRYLVSSANAAVADDDDNDPYSSLSLVGRGVCANQQEAQKLMGVINKYNSQDDGVSIKEMTQKQEERVRRVQELKEKLGIKKGQQEYVIGAAAAGHQETIVEEERSINQHIEQQVFQDDELSQILIQEDPQLLQDIINLLPQDDEDEKERIINMVNDVLTGANNEPSFSVHNRLYALAQAKQLGLVGRQEPVIIPPSYPRHGVNPLNLGHSLYQEHLEREQRQRTVQEAQNYMLEQQRIRSKVNIKSNELAYYKLQKAIAEALNYVDEDGQGELSYDQVGRLLYMMSIFKYSYSDDEKKINQIVDLRVKKQKILKLTYLELNLGKRIMQEDEFLSQFWLKVNPLNYERIDKRLIFEYLKLLYDPYIQSGTRIQEKEELMQECVNSIRQVFGLEPIMEDKINEQKQAHWSNAEIFMAIKVLTDNFSAAKIGGNGTGIKIPSHKKVKISEKSREHLTFKPEINQRSEVLEKRHFAKFIDKQLNQYQNSGDVENSLTSSQIERNNSSLAGKIVSKYQHSEQMATFQPQTNNMRPQTAAPILHQQNVDVSTRVNVLLEKDKMKQQRIREQKQQKEANALKECTFKPQINKTSNHHHPSSSQHVHNRLWELSKAKRINIQQENPSKFDRELEQLQECTFQPQINKRSKVFIEHKRHLEMNQLDNQQPPENMQQPEVLHIKGYEESVNRLKRAKEIQEIKKQMIENMGKVKGSSFGIHPTIQKPFNLHTQQQRQLQLQTQSQNSQPIIDVEITIGTGKVVHLTIREGDDIQKVLRNFSRTYALNEATKRNLESQINDYLFSIQQQDIEEDEGDLGRDSSPLDQLYLERNMSQPQTNERQAEQEGTQERFNETLAGEREF